ncbi:hypothetical protein [Nocardioides sp.]|uniref:hypothetical protein n=1 Tax=Nocardioides sp. TaxID=35761 RepID=UPI002621EE46|nr:hypothetical protein [Nocardioides sp.]
MPPARTAPPEWRAVRTGEPDGVATWSVHHVQDSNTSITRVSGDKVPAGALVEPLAYTFSGDFSSCTSGMSGGFPGTPSPVPSGSVGAGP